ncbi:hypothetical protein RA210_U180052 [Rubrivivax sp. A210]|nr:hypothetical protein RA210_U180052 [Rubrivivax sp. A210]
MARRSVLAVSTGSVSSAEAISSTATSSRLKLWMSCCTTRGTAGRATGVANRLSMVMALLRVTLLLAAGRPPEYRALPADLSAEKRGVCCAAIETDQVSKGAADTFYDRSGLTPRPP